MGIKEHVENLRGREPHEKRRVALVYSSIVTALIFVVWMSVMLPRGYNRTVAANPTDSSFVDAAGEFGKQLEVVKENFAAAGQAASAGFAAISTTSTATSSEEQYDFGY